MHLITVNKLQTILMGTVKTLINNVRGLNIFSGVQIGQDVFAAEGNEDILPIIAGNNMSIEATQNGITFSAGSNGVNSDMTVAEYEALTPEQKADPDTYYWLPDAQGADYDNIRDIVAPTEYSTAVDDHAVGDEFILGNDLYKAVQAITEGDTITPGTNAALAGTIVEQLKSLFEGESILKKAETLTNVNTSNSDWGLRYYYTAGGSYAPTTATSYYIIELSTDNLAYTAQIAIEIGWNSIYVRSKYGNNTAWPTTGNYGWKQIYGLPSLVETSSGSGVFYRKTGNIVEVFVQKDGVVWSNTDFLTLATLPSGYRPTFSITMFGSAGVTLANTMLSTIIHQDGRIMCTPFQAGTYFVRVHATFLAS